MSGEPESTQNDDTGDVRAAYEGYISVHPSYLLRLPDETTK